MTDGVSETSHSAAQVVAWRSEASRQEPRGRGLGTEEADVFQQVTCGKQNNRSSCWAQTGCSWKGDRTKEKATWT